VLPRHPVGPCLAQFLAVDLPELRRVVLLAALAAGDPFDHRLGPVLVRQVGHETSAVEVGVDLDLEIDLGSLGDQTQGAVEAAVITYHRAKDHLIPGAQSATDAARHPGLDKDCNAFVIPAGCGEPGRRQVGEENGPRVVLARLDLAGEELAPRAVAGGGLVARHDVNQLVVHQPVHPLVGRHDLVDKRQRRDLQHQHIARHRTGGGISAIGEIHQDDGDRLRRLPAPELSVKLERVDETARHVGRQIALGRLVVEETQVFCGHLVELGG